MIPLTYTKIGNIPSDRLDLVTSYEDHIGVDISFQVDGSVITLDWVNNMLKVMGLIKSDIVPVLNKSGYLNLHLRYIDKESGDEVRNDSHVISFQSLDMASGQGILK